MMRLESSHSRTYLVFVYLKSRGSLLFGSVAFFHVFNGLGSLWLSWGLHNWSQRCYTPIIGQAVEHSSGPKDRAPPLRWSLKG